MYENWKILKSEIDEKIEEYSQVAEWCNNSGEYHIELYIDENDVEWYRTVKNPEPLPPTKEEQEQNRANAYQQEVDPLHSRKQRKIILGEWTEDDEREYILKVKELSDKIVKEYPYEEKNNET